MKENNFRHKVRKLIIEELSEIADSTTYKLKINNHDIAFNKTNNEFKIDNIKMTINDFKKVVQFAKKNGIKIK